MAELAELSDVGTGDLGEIFKTLVAEAVQEFSSDPDLQAKIQGYASAYEKAMREQQGRAAASKEGEELSEASSTDTPTAEDAKRQREASRKEEDDRREQSKKDIDERVKRYKKTTGQWMAELVPSILGRVASGVGGYMQARNSILANALLGMADNAMSGETASIYGNPYKQYAPSVAAPLMTSGMKWGAAGDVLGGIGYELSKSARAENERVRNFADYQENSPPGQYFEAQQKQYPYDPHGSVPYSSRYYTDQVK